MTLDNNRDYTRAEQAALDLSDLFAHGLRAEDGRMRPEVQGIGMTAAAIQALDAGVRLEHVGLMLTNARENDLATTRAHPEDLTEELDEYCPALAALIRSAIASVRDDAEYRMLVQWIANLYSALILQQQARESGR